MEQEACAETCEKWAKAYCCANEGLPDWQEVSRSQ